MRNRVIVDGYIKDSAAPSYFVEGMLWIVANDQYGVGYQHSFTRAYDWVVRSDPNQLTCANAPLWLAHAQRSCCWALLPSTEH